MESNTLYVYLDDELISQFQHEHGRVHVFAGVITQEFLDLCSKYNIHTLIMNGNEMNMPLPFQTLIGSANICIESPLVERLILWETKLLQQEDLLEYARLFPNLKYLCCHLDGMNKDGIDQTFSSLFSCFPNLEELDVTAKDYMDLESALHINDGRTIKVTKLKMKIKGNNTMVFGIEDNMVTRDYFKFLNDFETLHVKIESITSIIQSCFILACMAVHEVEDFKMIGGGLDWFKESTFLSVLSTSLVPIKARVYHKNCVINQVCSVDIFRNAKRHTSLLDIVKIYDHSLFPS
jgi:hypothetical protein